MRTVLSISLGLFLLSFCACDDVGLVDKAKYDKVVQENVDLKKQIAEKEDQIKKIPRHHYSLHNEGLRTFRFDSDTGKTCIQLTTDADWKKADTKVQSCDCEDLFLDGAEPAEYVRKLNCGW